MSEAELRQKEAGLEVEARFFACARIPTADYLQLVQRAAWPDKR